MCAAFNIKRVHRLLLRFIECDFSLPHSAAKVHPACARGLDYAMGIFGLADRRLGKLDSALDRCSIAHIHLFRL